MEKRPRPSQTTRVVLIAGAVAVAAAWIVPSCRAAGEYRVEIAGPEPYGDRLCAALSVANSVYDINKDARPILGILASGSKAAAEIGVLPASAGRVALKLTLRRKDAKGLTKAQIRSFFTACEHEIRKRLPDALAKCARHER